MNLFNDFPIKYFNFYQKEEECEELNINAYYYETGYAAKLIHTILKNSKFIKTKDINKSNLIVGGKLENENKKIEKDFQRQNHFDFTFSLGSKAGYHKIMKKYKLKFNEFPSYYPKSFLLPEEYNDLLNDFSNSLFWIQKPAGGSRGNGIIVIDKPPKKTLTKIIVQKYIDKPLLINGLKFDLRFYIAVTSLVPLRVYLFNNGLVRLATELYENNFQNIDNRSAHLTNFSINKENPDFQITNDLVDDGKGNKWSHKPFWPWLNKQGFNINEIKTKIEDTMASIIITSRDTFKKQSDHRNSFELFGFDIMITQNGEIYALEVNVSPALGTSSNLDMYIKSPLVKDLFNLSLIPQPSNFYSKIENIIKNKENLQIIEALIICEYEIANTRIGDFKCIFPNKESIPKLSNIFESIEFEDQILWNWINKSKEEKEVKLIEYINILNSLN